MVELLNQVTAGFLAFSGVVAESMTRGQAWRFLVMGNLSERAISMARLVRSTLVDVPADESSILDAVLEIADSSLTYRRRYLTQLEAPAVVDLLIADETNPRLDGVSGRALLEDHLAHLPREGTHPQRNGDRQAALKLRTELKLADLHAACKPVRARNEAGARCLDDRSHRRHGQSLRMGQPDLFQPRRGLRAALQRARRSRRGPSEIQSHPFHGVFLRRLRAALS